MDFFKLDSTFDKEQLEDMFYRLLYAETNGNTLSAPAKETSYSSADKELPEELPWTAYSLIRIAPKQGAVIVCDNKVIASRAKPGDYAIQDEIDLSSAKVYFVTTEEKSSKMLETHAPIAFRAENKSLGVSQDIHIQCAGYFNYRISRPKEFIKYAIAQKNKRITKQSLEAEMSSIFSVCLPDLLGQLAAEGVPYTEICAYTDRITEYMREKLAIAWKNCRGIELKKFSIVMAQANRDDENAFLELCRRAEEAQEKTSFDTEGFSEEFSSVLKGLGKAAGDALNSFSKEIASIFDGLADDLDEELDESEADEVFDDFDLDSILDGGCTEVMGTWECAELGQTVRFELLYAVIEANGQQIWMGDWEECPENDGTKNVICPTANGLGCYKYFEYHNDDGEEYLAGIILDTGNQKQYVRFIRAAE